jgi:hypothetical protein
MYSDRPKVGSGRIPTFPMSALDGRPSLPQKVEVSYSIQSACTQWIRQPPSFKRRLRTVNSNRLGKFTAVVYRLYISVNFLTRNQTSCKLHNILLAQCIKHFLNGSDICLVALHMRMSIGWLRFFSTRSRHDRGSRCDGDWVVE